MIAFCTHCWSEIDAADDPCLKCHAHLGADSRSYEEKLVAALAHPLPAARVRICWLIAENNLHLAVPALMEAAVSDPDLYVRKAALEGLAALQDPRSVPLLRKISESDNRFLARAVKRGLGRSTATK
ncbi:MAG: HEAT repeat domain-containing protein [Terracidiphilus sp.]